MRTRLLSASTLCALVCCAGIGAAGPPVPVDPVQPPVALVLGWGGGGGKGLFARVAVVTLADWRVHWVSHGLTGKAVALQGVWYSTKSKKLVVDFSSPNFLLVFGLCSGEKQGWGETIQEGAIKGWYEGAYVVADDEDGIYIDVSQEPGGGYRYDGVPNSFLGPAHLVRYDLSTGKLTQLKRQPTVFSGLARAGFWASSPAPYLRAAADALAKGHKVPAESEHIKALHQEIAPQLIQKGLISQDALLSPEKRGAKVLSAAQPLEDAILQIDTSYLVCRVRDSLSVLMREGDDFKAIASSPPGFGAKDANLLRPDGVVLIYDPSVLRCLNTVKWPYY